MILRSNRPSDLPVLHEIDRQCFPPDIAYTRAELEGFIRHKNSKTWIAENEGRIVGFLVVSREAEKVGHLITLDVLRAERRHGIGRALIRAAEEWARSVGIEVLYLETAEDNRPAQQFYKACHFRKVERLANYYGRGKAAWVMIKRLA